jgi:hypothetical protein
MRRRSLRHIKAAFDTYRELVRTHPRADHSGFLLGLIGSGVSEEERLLLESSLVSEYQRRKRFRDAESILERHARRNGSHPYPYIALAEHFHYSDIDRRKAITHVAVAVRNALRTGEFGYQALGVQARLAFETKQWQLLKQTITALTQYRHKTGRPDVFPETDFLARIPRGKVPVHVLREYERRVQYLRRIGYSTLTGRSTRTRASARRLAQR